MKSSAIPKTVSEKKVGNKSDIKKWYEQMLSMRNVKKRGYEFERIIYSILTNEKLSPTASYKTEGEQIDGTFLYSNLPFLFEAKWHKKPLPASDLYEFKGKVDGKFHLVTGVFISISGYSPDAPIALIKGKTENIILFDKSDMEEIILKNRTFKEVLQFKIEKASYYGDPYVRFTGKELVEKGEKQIKTLIIQ